MTQVAKKRGITRRQFLVGAGGFGAGLVVLFYGGLPILRKSIAENTNSFTPKPTDDPNAWLRVLPNHRVQFMVNKMEMGQGVQTAMAQIVADELDVPLEQVDAVYVTTDVMPRDSFGTFGSMSIASSYPALRAAAAEARETLKLEASKRLGRPATELLTRAGRVLVAGDLTQAVGYGDLVANQTLVRVLKEKAPLKNPRDFQVIGQSVARVDVPDKLTGRAQYGADAWVDGMLHGKVAHPPSLGAKMGRVDISQAIRAPGVVKVIHEGDFVGVVATTEEDALRGLGAVTIEWQAGKAWQHEEIDALLTVGGGDGVVLREAGQVETALRGATQRVEATYRTPFAAQAPLEMQVGLADVRADRAKVWTSTQSPFLLRTQVAKALGLAEDKVEIQPMYIGGGYGRKSYAEAAIEAARLSKAVGQPVRVAWSRSEEFENGYLRPPTLSQFRAGLDASGRISAWDYQQASGMVLFGNFPLPLRLMFGSDFGATRGLLTDYGFGSHRTTAYLKELPVRTGSWRGLGLAPNVFAVEGFMDELAYAAGQDPLAFRLAHLDVKAERMRAVLTAAAERAGWGTPLPEGRGRGIACCQDVGSYVAQVAEVTVNRQTGRIKVDRVVTAFDCGLIVNPNIVEAQVEGNVMWGVGTALLEEVTVADGRITAANFNNYPILSLRDAPETEVVLLNRPDLPPTGVGEPPIGPVAAAVANAVFAAVGARMRSLPMTPERVLQALAVA